jgi:hypothetical protein
MSGVIGQAVAIGRQVTAQYRPDTYQIVRGTVAIPDSAGGYTATPAVVESGGCVLTAGAIRPAEQAIADRAGATVTYTVRNMPHDTTLLASDTLTINGRTFEVLGVLRGEATDVAVTAVCQERT